MRTALAVIAACHWDAEHAEVRWLVSTICGGMNQTRISEEAHKVMRSQEASSGQKTLSHLKTWQAPCKGRVIDAYGMTEVTPVDVANTCTSGDLSKLFDSRLVDRTFASAHTAGTDPSVRTAAAHWTDSVAMVQRVRSADHEGIGGTHQTDIEEMANLHVDGT
eukprot:5547282-Amphidinium_carterae.2